MERLQLSFKLLLGRVLRVGLFMFLTGALFAPSLAYSQSRCENIFQPVETGSYQVPLIQMNENYRGEDRGLYLDPITQRPWQVKYFNRAELNPFEVRFENGLFVNRKGERMESPFDGESLSYDTGLIVIDRSLNIYLMPFESRGVYHHSSLSGGRDILFAGTASFSNGRLREFTNDSGHYKPSTMQTLKVLRMLHEQGADLSGLKLGGRAVYELSKTYSMNFNELNRFLPELFGPQGLSNAHFEAMVAHIPATP